MNPIHAQMLLRKPGSTFQDGTKSGDWARYWGRSLCSPGSADDVCGGSYVPHHRHVLRGRDRFRADQPSEWLYVILGGTAKPHGQSRTPSLGIGDAFVPDVSLPGLSASRLVVAVEELHLMRLRGRHCGFTRARVRRRTSPAWVRRAQIPHTSGPDRGVFHMTHSLIVLGGATCVAGVAVVLRHWGSRQPASSGPGAEWTTGERS